MFRDQSGPADRLDDLGPIPAGARPEPRAKASRASWVREHAMSNKDRGNESWRRPTTLVIGFTFVALVICALTTLPVLSRTTQAVSERVDKIFAQWDRSDSPGCAVAVIKDGTVLYKRGYGVADLDHGIAITPETVFHAASLSKQFTAMAVMLLVGQGRLALDDDVRKYVGKEFPLDGITVGDLLRHTSGIRDQWALMTMAGWRMSDDVITQGDVLRLVARTKELNFPPGTDFAYSNTNYTLTGLIVERVSKRSLADFARDNIFLPLGMLHTTFAETHGVIVHNRAYGYRVGAKQAFELRMPNYDLYGPTNLQTTVEDLARWDRNFEDKKVGHDAALAQMQTSGVTPTNGPTRYGLGLKLEDYRQLRTVGHDGRDAGYRAQFIRFPDRRFAVACLCNLAFPEDSLPGDLVQRIADVYLFDHPASASLTQTASETAPAVPQRSGADLRAYTGRYYSEEIDSAYDVELRDQSLGIVRPRYPFTKLVPTPGDRDSFTMSVFSVALPQTTVRFGRDPHGQVAGFLMDADDGRISNFKFLKAP
jgi:CubicO group peptidase (beta-lactamase class C family)